jgi:hypothetical protein
VSLLADLGYDADRIKTEINDIELTIDNFDSWTYRQSLAITSTCNCVQYPDVRAVLV